MSMASLYISLPQAFKDYLESQVKEGVYSTPSEHIRKLVREDQKRRAEQTLEALLLEGINSGTPIEITSEYLEEKRRQLMQRNKSRKRKTGTR